MNKYNRHGLQICPQVFQHPKNVALGKQLKENSVFTKALEFISKNGLERSLRGKYLSSYLLVTPSTAPEIIRMRDEACEMFGVENKPEIFLYRNYDAVSNMKGIDHPMILMSTEMVNSLSEQALWGIVASTVSAIGTDYCAIRTVEESISTIKLLVPTAFSMPLDDLNGLLGRWRRSMQYSLDRAALIATADFNLAMQGILAGEAPEQVLESIDFADPECTYMKQCLKYFNGQNTVMKAVRSADTLLNGVIPYATRYLELYNFYKDEYFDLMDEYSDGVI